MVRVWRWSAGCCRVELSRDQLNLFAGQVSLPPGRIDNQVTETRGGSSAPACIAVPARGRRSIAYHPGDELARAEGFGHVVIGADGQAHEFVDLVDAAVNMSTSQSENVLTRRHTSTPSFAGAGQVENDEVGLALSGSGHCVGAVWQIRAAIPAMLRYVPTGRAQARS